MKICDNDVNVPGQISLDLLRTLLLFCNGTPRQVQRKKLFNTLLIREHALLVPVTHNDVGEEAHHTSTTVRYPRHSRKFRYAHVIKNSVEPLRPTRRGRSRRERLGDAYDLCRGCLLLLP